LKQVHASWLVPTALALSSVASAAPIPVTNQGFESPVASPGGFTTQPTVVPGWTYLPSGGAGIIYPTVASWGYVTPHGNQVLYTNGSSYEQVTGATVQPNRTYTLRVALVERPAYSNSYTIQLRAGSTVVAQDNNSVHPPDGAAADSVLVYNSPASGPTIGQPISIRLGGTTQTNFDNVRLSDSVPVACPGDINGDGDTNAADFVILAGNFGSAVPANTGGDLNGDGLVNAADFVILAGDFGCNG
jgi:hypothetical protein